MFGLFLVTVMLLFHYSYSTVSQKDCTINHSKTNIVLVIADDLGWADIGFSHKPDGFVSDKGIPETPHLDRTAREGLVLDNLYTQAACTPTRGSLMTGKYAFRLGQLFASYVLTTADKKGPSDRFLSEVSKYKLLTTSLIKTGFIDLNPANCLVINHFNLTWLLVKLNIIFKNANCDLSDRNSETNFRNSALIFN